MKLTVTNFRCYGSRIFEIPDEGIVLIHGTSGAGKSSLLKAISYVLYGKEKKCVKYKETKCTVELEYKNFKIIRTNKPSAIVTLYIDNNTYTGEAAQELINKMYGDYSYFGITSYVAQKSIESFINLSASSKIEFFNSLALKDIDVSIFKERTKEQIKSRKQLVNNKTNEIKILKNQLDSFVLPDNVEYPLKSGNYDTREVEKERKLWQNNTDKLNILNKNIKDINQKEKLLIEHKQNFITKKNKLDTLQTELDKYKLELADISTTDYEDHNIIYNIILSVQSYLQTYLNYEKNRKELDEYVKSLLTSYKIEIEKIEEGITKLNFNFEEFEIVKRLHNNKQTYIDIIDLLTKMNSKDYDKIHEFIEDKNIYKEQLIITEKSINELNYQLQVLDKEIDKLKNNKSIKCPGCKAGLLMIDHDLVLHNSEKNELQIKTLKTKIKVITNEINEASIIRDNLYIKSNIWDKLNYKLQNNKTDYLIFLKYTNYINGSIDINILEEKFKSIKQQNLEYTKLSNLRDNLQISISKVENKEEKSVELKRKELTSLKNDLSVTRQKKNKSISNLDKNIIELFNRLITEDDDEFEPLETLEEIEEYDENEMLDIVDKLAIKVSKIISTKEVEYKNINKIKQNIELYESQIKNLEIVEFNPAELDELLNSKKQLEDDIESRERKQKIYEKRSRQLDRFLAYNNEIIRYNKLKSDIEICEKEEKMYIKSLSVAENFEKLLNEAETISVSNTLENINMSIRYYMSKFFPEGNMQMELTPFRENKKGDKTTGLDIDIYYDGEKTGLDNLSGGEYDRVLLVLFLSFNTMSKGDIIMLDECLSSLNSELVEEIIEIIKTTLTGKLILVTLHQANIGIFDNLIEL